MFNNGILLITGGTGSFGNAVLRHFLHSDLQEIRIFSRDEKKQDDMRRLYNNPKIQFYLGDVRDKNSVNNAVKGVDFIFHAAALKQVPSCEFFPMEAIKTNVIGTENVISSAIEHGVKKFVLLSTDKAVYPINAMGLSKALAEKVMIAASKKSNVRTVLSATRYGNVMASRGSVIPLFKQQIENSQPITITDPAMTRYMMTLNEAVDLVLYAFANAKGGDVFVQKSPASTIHDLAVAMMKKMEKEVPIRIIGTRHGEKLYETLVNREEMAKAEDLGTYYRIPADERDLNYENYFSEGGIDISLSEEYTSHNTHRLSVDEVVQLLGKLDLFEEQV